MAGHLEPLLGENAGLGLAPSLLPLPHRHHERRRDCDSSPCPSPNRPLTPGHLARTLARGPRGRRGQGPAWGPTVCAMPLRVTGKDQRHLGQLDLAFQRPGGSVRRESTAFRAGEKQREKTEVLTTPQVSTSDPKRNERGKEDPCVSAHSRKHAGSSFPVSKCGT